MTSSWLTGGLLMAGVMLAAGCAGDSSAPTAEGLNRLQLPEGFHVALFADSVPHARSLARSPGGIVFVGNREGDHVYALPDRDGNGRANPRH